MNREHCSQRNRRLFLHPLTLLCLFLIPTNVTWGRQDQDTGPIELSGFSISETFEISDDEKISLENPFLKRLMFRIIKTSPQSRCEYRSYTIGVEWDQIRTQTSDYRCRVFERSGTVKEIWARRIPGTDADSRIRVAYICACENERGEPFLVLSLDIPQFWLSQFEEQRLKLDEPIRFEGFLFGLCRFESSGPISQPLFVASTLSWYPTSKNFDRVVDSHLELARAGFDIGLLDLAQAYNTKPLNQRDAEAFYQMLSVVDKANPKHHGGISFQELMEKASRGFGQQISVSGVVRQCTEIRTTDPDLLTRMDLTRYYQMILFPDLDGKNIVIRNSEGREDINQRLPITVVFKTLPKGWKTEELERQSCRVDGFVYRFWRFQTERTDQSGFAGQISPLIMVGSPVVLEKVNAELDGLLYGFIVTVLLCVIGVVFYYRYVDRKHKTPGAKILDELPDKISVSFSDE